MCQDTDVEILWRIRSGWKAFATIKDVLKTLHANLFNSTVLLVMLYASISYHKDGRKEFGYSTEGYGKIHTGIIVA